MKEYRLTDWLPTTKKEMELRGWDELDVILFSGDAYVDHPSFGAAVIGRLLEAQGLKVDYQTANLMCEVVCRSRYEWLYNDVWPFYGTVNINARSAVMEAQGTAPDRFTVTYLSNNKKQISY